MNFIGIHKDSVTNIKFCGFYCFIEIFTKCSKEELLISAEPKYRRESEVISKYPGCRLLPILSLSRFMVILFGNLLVILPKYESPDQMNAKTWDKMDFFLVLMTNFVHLRTNY